MKRFGLLVIDPASVAAVLPSRKFMLTGEGFPGYYDVLLHSGDTIIVAAEDAEKLIAELVAASDAPTPKED